MVKKTLLSLAIAATAAGLAGCNVSSTDKYENDIDQTPITAGQSDSLGPIAVFSPARSAVPTSIDLLFAAASATDGSASTADTTPPVTTAINDLTGFSATASIDIPFSSRLDEATILDNVHLIQLRDKTDDSTIDALDIESIGQAAAVKYSGNPIKSILSQGTDFELQYVEMDNGATPTIRIHPLKPLVSKAKYVVAVTSGVKDPNGNAVRPSPSYTSFLDKDAPQFSDALVRVGKAVRAWHGVATAAENAVGGATPDQVVLSYAFTTEAKEDVLLAMAAPENYIFGLLNDTATMEKLLIGDDDPEDPANAVNQLVAGAALILNTGGASFDPLNLSDADRLVIRLSSQYKELISNTLAKAIINGGAAQTAAAGIVGSSSTILGAIDNWNTAPGNAEKQISLNPAEWDDAQKGYIAQALGQYTDSTTNTELVATAANGAGALLKDAAKRPAARAVTMIPGVSISNGMLRLPAPSVTQQGMIKLPQFMERKKVNGASFWKGSADVGAVIDAALGNPSGTTPPQDDDGSLNVSYRFPFAQYVEDVAVPVLVTYPDTVNGTCVKPTDGWETIIFQHGITTDRTASLGFANQMAAAAAGCYATVAIDMVAHGVDASTTDRNGNPIRYTAFNPFNVAGYVDGANTPFATTLAALAEADNATFAGLAERHENLATNSQNQVVPMSFAPGSESGNSGDLFINLTNFQQSRDHLRQSVMDLLNLNASIVNIPDLDPTNVYFVGHSLGAMVGMTFVAVNNTVANNLGIVSKELNPIKAAVFGNPGGQIPKLLENSPQFSARIIPGLAEKGLTQGTTNLEKYFSILQATLDTVDPVNFVELLKVTNTPVLMFEMVGGGAIDPLDTNTNPNDLIPNTGLSDKLIQAIQSGALPGYPADTVVPNNASPSLNSVETGISHLAGTDPLIDLLGLTEVSASSADELVFGSMLVSKFGQGTHGTISSADAPTVFAEIIKQSASFLGSGGAAVQVGNPDKLAD